MAFIRVFAASKMEAQPALAFVRKGAQKAGDFVEGNQIAVIITGMGPKNAERSAQAALGLSAPGGALPKPDAVLIIGLCGGLIPAIQQGRIVLYEQCFSTDSGPALACSKQMTDAIAGILQVHSIPCDRVTGVASPRIASSKDERLALARLGADVVDMETHAILAAAAQARVPAAVLRVVSDSLDSEMPDFNPALDARGDLALHRAALVALASPMLTWRLVSASKRAMKRLAPAVQMILLSSCFDPPPL